MRAKAKTPAPKRPALTSSLEREIKLRVTSRFRLPKLPGKPLPPRQLISTYFDTVDYRLARVPITLRHRVEQGKGLWQLKLPSDDGRQELEIAGGADALPSELEELLTAHLRGDKVVPVATLRTWRKGFRVRGPKGPVADVVVDAVSVLDKGRLVRRFRELEIEQLNDDKALFAHLEQTIRAAGAGDHDGRPKLFQALDLPAPSENPPAPEATVTEQISYMIGRQVRALLAHDPGTRLGKDIEDLHRMRVATRRLRTLLRVAEPLLDPEWIAPLRTEVSWLGERLGAVRDLDVQVAYFQDEATTLTSRDRRPLQRFIEHLRQERAAAQQALVRELQSSHYLKLIAMLLQAEEQPPIVASDLTLDAIAARQFKKLKKSVKRLDDFPTNAELHRVRIQTKRARYAAELAQLSQGKPAARFAEQARSFQDLLGGHQDAVLAEEHIRAFVTRTKGIRAAFVAGRMVERQRLRRDVVRSTMDMHWQKLKKRGKKAWGSA